MDSVNKWLTLAANVGVIAGIIFLGIEVKQNNEEIAAQSRFNYYQSRSENVDSWGQDKNTIDILLKSLTGFDLNPEEELMLTLRLQATIILWEYEFGEYVLERLSDEEMNPLDKKRIYDGWGEIGKVVWGTHKKTAPLEFVNWFEKNIVNADF
jgi:hypothetical protein